MAGLILPRRADVDNVYRTDAGYVRSGLNDESTTGDPLIVEFIDLVTASDPWTERVAQFALTLLGGDPHEIGESGSLVPALRDQLTSLHGQGVEIALLVRGVLRLLDAVFERRESPARVSADTRRLLRWFESVGEDRDAAVILASDAGRAMAATAAHANERLAAASNYFTARRQLSDGRIDERFIVLIGRMRGVE